MDILCVIVRFETFRVMMKYARNWRWQQGSLNSAVRLEEGLYAFTGHTASRVSDNIRDFHRNEPGIKIDQCGWLWVVPQDLIEKIKRRDFMKL